MTQRDRIRRTSTTGSGDHNRPETAGIYCRLSLARFGDTTKVDDQERICRELATQRGWRVPEEFVWKDNGRSAWRHDRKRPGWDAMMRAIEAGRVTNIVTYHGDRMWRQPYDLETLIRLGQRGITITSPTGVYRLDVPEDRFQLGILANVARLESDNTSRRKRAGFARLARDGYRPPAGSRWGRGFGYDTMGRTPVPGEAAALREAAIRVIDGEPLSAVAADLTARGLRSTSGRPLSYKLLKEVLLRPRTAGLLPDGEPGSWEAIIEPDTQSLVAATLAGRGHRGSNTQTYLLTGIARCGACGRGLQRSSTGRAGQLVLSYGCRAPGCRKVHRNMIHLDEYVITRALAKLSDPRNPAGHPPPSEHAQEIADLISQRAEAEAAVTDPSNEAHLDLLLRRLTAISTRLASLRALADGSAANRLLAGHAGLSRKQWDALPLATRRALIAACFTVAVDPSARRGPGFDTGAVRLLPPRGADAQ